MATAERQQYYLMKGLNKAIRDYQMIEDGDRIAVGVSGGKDSLTLLQLLHARQGLVKERYTLVAVHVIGDADTCAATDHLIALHPFLEALGVAHETVPLDLPSGHSQRRNQSPCFHCAWRRRKALLLAADRLGCNKLALGHHADDLAQTTLLNLFFQGRVETMEPRVHSGDGRIDLIRPLANIREQEIARFARAAELPVVAQRCAGAEDSSRELMRDIISQVSKVYPKVRINLVRAGLRGRCADDGGPGEASVGPTEA